MNLEPVILQDKEDNSLNGMAKIILAKHRNCSMEKIDLKFIEIYTRFVEPDQDIPLPYPSRNYDLKMNNKTIR